MNKLWVGSIAVALALGSVAHAADLPVGPVPAVAVPPVVNWSGLYIGGHGGFAWSRLKFSVGIPDGNCVEFGGTSTCEDFRFSPSSFIGGGQVGLQSQVEKWVFGIEATWSGLDLQGSRASIVDPTSFRSVKLNEIGTVDARFGYAGWGERMLVYAKAGYATARIGVHLLEGAGNIVVTATGATGDATGWKPGFTIGAGVEYMVWQNLVLGLEFDFYNFDFDTKLPRLFSDGTPSFQIFGSNADVYAVTARLSYLFNWGKTPTAIVAKY